MDLFPVYCPSCKRVTPAGADYCPECSQPLKPGLPPLGAEVPAEKQASDLPPASDADRDTLPVALGLLAFWALVALGALFRPTFPSPPCLLGLVLLLWDGVYLAQQPSLPVQVNGAFGLGLVLGVTFSSTLAWLRSQF